MGYKRFGPEDIVYTTLVTKPEYSFIVHSGSVYRDNEILPDGNFSNKLKHISNGEVSFHEININRPSGSLAYSFISKDTTRYAFSTISTSAFNNAGQFKFGNILKKEYPLKAGLSRIYVEDGPEFSNNNMDVFDPPSFAGDNKKYIRALKNVINSRDYVGKQFEYGNLGTSKVNMVCVPGIFYGSTMDKGSIELNYYITGTLVASARDSNKDGVLYQAYGQNSGSTAGIVLYEQGIVILTGSWDLSNGTHTDTFGVGTSPTWLNFGTGLPLVGAALPSTPTSILSSSYQINFKGTNKIPTLTMMAYAEKGEFNYSNNPSFLLKSAKPNTHGTGSFSEPEKTIKNITKSDYANHSASFVSTTFISKVGIYDEDKNLIAIATLANPLKKTPSRDYMIKLRMDF